MESAIPQLACLLIADDLTGACDAAVHFAAHGYRTLVSLTEGVGRAVWPAGAGVLALSTESRGMSAGELRAAYAGLGGSDCASAVVFKKIDSTLRGNVGAEIALAAEIFGCESAIVTPAFPALGRTVECGTLRVAGGGFDPIELPGYWRAQNLLDCIHTPPGGLAASLAAGARFISVDAVSDADLDAIAAVGIACGRRILWAGSAGLASALARACGGIRRQPDPQKAWAPRAAPLRAGHRAVLFCIGSDHPVTLEQQRELLANRAVTELQAGTAAEALDAVLHNGRHVLLRIPYAGISPERIRELIGGWRGPLVLSGGSTASLICRALDVREILLHREIAHGIPLGEIRGGLFDGMPLATKSGAFGNPDALVQVLDDLICP